jgi:hypothetical protein
MLYLLLIIIVLLIVYDTIVITKKQPLMKKKTHNHMTDKVKEEDKGCLYKFNTDNDNCTIKTDVFTDNQCKLRVSSTDYMHPSLYDWTSLDIKY